MLRRDLIKSIALVPAILSFSPVVQADEFENFREKLERSINYRWMVDRNINNDLYQNDSEKFKKIENTISVNKNSMDYPGVIEGLTGICRYWLDQKCTERGINLTPVTSVKLIRTKDENEFINYNMSFNYLVFPRIYWAKNNYKIGNCEAWGGTKYSFVSSLTTLKPVV